MQSLQTVPVLVEYYGILGSPIKIPLPSGRGIFITNRPRYSAAQSRKRDARVPSPQVAALAVDAPMLASTVTAKAAATVTFTARLTFCFAVLAIMIPPWLLILSVYHCPV
jgi:hypothetical protein